MNDFYILFLFTPLIFWAFENFKPYRQSFVWTAAAIAAGCLAFFLYKKNDWDSVLIVVACLGATLIQFQSQWKNRFIDVLGAIVLSQALVANDLKATLILIFVADGLFCTESAKENIRDQRRALSAYLASLGSLLPLAAGLLLQLPDAYLLCAFLVTVALRLLGWPLKNWPAFFDPPRSHFLNSINAISVFGLWRAFTLIHPITDVHFYVYLFILGAVLSVGVGAVEMGTVLALSLYLKEPALGMMFVIVWPCLFLETRSSSWLIVFILVSGFFLSSGLLELFVPEVSPIIAGLAGVLLARPLGSVIWPKAASVHETLVFVSVLVFGSVYLYLHPFVGFEVGVTQPTLVLGFMLVVGVTYFFRNKKPILFSRVPTLPLRLERFLVFKPQDSVAIAYLPKPIREPIFASRITMVLESYSYFIFILGAFCLLILWGFR